MFERIAIHYLRAWAKKKKQKTAYHQGCPASWKNIFS